MTRAGGRYSPPSPSPGRLRGSSATDATTGNRGRFGLNRTQRSPQSPLSARLPPGVTPNQSAISASRPAVMPVGRSSPRTWIGHKRQRGRDFANGPMYRAIGDCTARRRCSSASSRSRPRVPEAATAATASATRLGLKSSSCRPLRDVSGVGPQASLGRVDQRQGRSHEGRTRPTGRRAPRFCVRADCERLQDIVRDDRSGRGSRAGGPSAQTPPSPRRSRRQRRPDARARPSFLSERVVIVRGDDRSSRGSGRTTTDRSDAPICDGSPMRVHYAAGEIDGEEYGRRRTGFIEVR